MDDGLSALLSALATPSYPLHGKATVRAVVDSLADTSWVPHGCVTYASADYACAEPASMPVSNGAYISRTCIQ